MRTMVTVLLMVGVVFGAVWAWNEWNAVSWSFSGPEGLDGGSVRRAVDGFGGAICKAWGC